MARPISTSNIITNLEESATTVLSTLSGDKMTTVNTQVYDDSVQHAASLRRHEELLDTKLQRIMRNHDTRLTKLVGSSASDTAILKEVNRLKKELSTFSSQSVSDVLDAELDFHANSLNRAVGKLYKVKRAGRTNVLSSLFGSGIRSNRNLEQQVGSIINQQEERIKAFISKNPDPTKSLRRNGLVETTKITRGQLRSLQTTTITQAQSTAFLATANANSDVIENVRYTAVLDSRTSTICQSHDGEIYALDDKRFIPPLHWNCRSVLVPVIVPRSTMESSASSRFNKTAIGKLTGNQVLRFDGIPPRKETYDAWLRRQPMEVQLEHLHGDVDAFALWQKGTIRLEKFSTRKGTKVDISTLRSIDATTVGAPVTIARDVKAANHYYKIDAYRVDDLIDSPQARQQLLNLFIIDADSSVSPLSTTDFKGILSNTKRSNKIKANTVTDKDYYFDPVTGETYNPWIYRPNSEVLEERLALVNSSTILNNEQKQFITSFQASLTDKVSLNQRAVAIDNLRVVFERQLKPGTNNFGRPWENFTAVVRAENVNSVQNVSKRLNVTERRRANKFVGTRYKDLNAEAAINIYGEPKSLNAISRDISANQRYVSEWTDTQGKALAENLFYTGNLPFRNYFLPSQDSNPLDFKKNLIKAVDKRVDRLNLPGRIKASYQEFADKYLVNPLTATEDRIAELARNADLQFWDVVTLEIARRKIKDLFRIGILDKTRTASQNKAIRALAGALEEVAKGSATDYDSVAIAIGKRLHEDFKLEFPFSKATLADHHKNGSRVLKALQDRGLIKTGQAVKTRKAAIDVASGQAKVGGWREVTTREIEIVDPALARRQQVDRELYVARRIGITEEKNRLYKRVGTIKYEDKLGRVVEERAITRSAASQLGNDPEALARHMDRDFVNQLNYANKQQWQLDNEFTSFFEDLVLHKSREINLFKDLTDKRGEQGVMMFQTLKWHRQNGTKWTNLHQFDGRGRFYEQGYLASTRGEFTRPFLEAPDARAINTAAAREIAIQLGATVGDSFATLTQQGRLAAFEENLDDILDLGAILQRRRKQRSANLDDFLKNNLIKHVDDVDDAAEIGKIARYSLEVKRIEDHLNADGFTLRSGKNRRPNVPGTYDSINIEQLFTPSDLAKVPKGAATSLRKYKSTLNVENDASASGAQQIALAAKDKGLAAASNVIPTKQKQRLYDIAAMQAAADPRLAKYQALGLTWKDMQKAAKAQNMVSFYGAGEVTKAANVESKFAKVLIKNTDEIVVFKDKAPEDTTGRIWSQSRLNATIDRAIGTAETDGLLNYAAELREVKVELNQMLNKDAPIGSKLMKHAQEADDDVAIFVNKVTNGRSGLIKPSDFARISEVMTEKVAAIAPSTTNFIRFYKEQAREYTLLAGNTEPQWVNYRGKRLQQFYRPEIEEAISWRDPITGRTVTNIYKDVASNGTLRSAKSAGDAATGLGVNGNHMNDGSLVQGYWLAARRTNRRVASIHDGFFAHVVDADWTKTTLNELMAEAVDSNTIRNTIMAQRDAALQHVDRESRRERYKILDGLASKLNRNELTKNDIANSFQFLPGLKDAVKADLNLTEAQLSNVLGGIHRTNLLEDIKLALQDGRAPVSAVNQIIKDAPAFERALQKEFGVSTNTFLNQFAKHGNTARLERNRQRFIEGVLDEGSFFRYNFQEPALTDVEKGLLSNARRKAKAARKPVPTPSEALGKKPSPQEVLRTRYGIGNEGDFVAKVNSGEFSFERFFRDELKRNEGGTDLNRVLSVVNTSLKSNEVDLNVGELASSFRKFRRGLLFGDLKRKQQIRQWYKDRIKRAQELELIDKNKTHAVVLKRLDSLQKDLSKKRLTKSQLPQFYKDWEKELRLLWNIDNLPQLNRAFLTGSVPNNPLPGDTGGFSIDKFVTSIDYRYRELTKSDLLRNLQPGEDAYGIGP